MAYNDEQSATQKCFSKYWQKLDPLGHPVDKIEGIVLSLEAMAECYDKTIPPQTARLYIAALEDCSKEQIILAFSRAIEECKFFPSPSILREFSGLAAFGNPLTTKARDQLICILTAMRGPHGPELRDIPGRVLYGTEDDPKDETGARTHAPIRAAGTPLLLDSRAEAALLRLGWGSREAGIAAIAQHPSLRRQKDRDAGIEFQWNDLRRADEIFERFAAAYREVTA